MATSHGNGACARLVLLLLVMRGALTRLAIRASRLISNALLGRGPAAAPARPASSDPACADTQPSANRADASEHPDEALGPTDQAAHSGAFAAASLHEQVHRRQLMQALALVPAAAVMWTPRAAFAGAMSSADNALVLGHSCALDGPMSGINLEAMQGAAWHFQQVNLAGGVGGRPVRIETLDDAYDAKRTGLNARELVTKHGALALFNVAGTPTSLAAIAVAKELDVPMVAPFTGSGLLRRQLDRLVFNVRAGFDHELDAICEHLMTIGVHDASVVYMDNAFGKDGMDSVAQSAGARGLVLKSSASINKDNKDSLRAAAEKIAKGSPRAVIMILAGALPGEFVRVYRQIGRSTQFYALSVVSPKELLTQLGDQAVGIVISQVMPSATSGSTALGREVASFARANGVREPTQNHMEGYVAAKVMTEGLRRAGTRVSTASLVAGLESMKGVDLGGLRVTFSNQSHNGSTYVDLSVVGTSKHLIR